MDRVRQLGLLEDGRSFVPERRKTLRAIALKLAAMGHVLDPELEDEELRELSQDLFARYAEQSRLLTAHLSGADRRVQDFLDEVLADVPVPGPVRLPTQTFVLDRHGLSRELSLPVDGDRFENPFVTSYRTDNGVLHNPRSDRRTTQGVFHVADVGLPVPADKLTVPRAVFGRMLHAALNPPDELLELPFASQWRRPIRSWVSLLLRPLVCPEVPGVSPARSLEVRFLAPGGLVANLDFVESIFGNAGDPYLPENDAGLDVEHWTGHSGLVILAPHLLRMTKQELGLPHAAEATEAQRAQGMCWDDPAELYNGGKAFKATMRDRRGIMVTLLTDNYFGYCKKEVKTQISMSANLYGLAEEEHAGGALAFPSYKLGEQFAPGKFVSRGGHRFDEALRSLGSRARLQDDGHAVDTRFPEIHYLPEDFTADLREQRVRWTHEGRPRELKLLPGHVYVHPSGYKVRMEKSAYAPSWQLTGTSAEGVFCHKPSTVSGGGKSEISKSVANSVLSGPIWVHDLEADMAAVADLLARDYSGRFEDGSRRDNRPILSAERSLGSVIKLFTPSTDYTQAHNAFLEGIPRHVLALVFVIKRFYQPAWNGDWRGHFTVDVINGEPGHELKFDGRKIVGRYLRVGLQSDGGWRTYKLRQDYNPSDKVQMEDDITASVLVPSALLEGLPESLGDHPSVKMVENCEWRLFQRPDDAVVPGYDRETEADMAGPGIFASNYQPLEAGEVRELVDDVVLMDAFTEPMAEHLRAAAARERGYTVCSAFPRLIDGKRSKNPRYLQVRPDAAEPRDRYLAEIGARLERRLDADAPVHFPVTSVLQGRRNNPPEPGVRALAVYGPIHYQELPELFMDWICSLTGKSPSTTGAGSEGALTKGPFNALRPAADLNAALVGMILSGYDGFSSAAGWIGPHVRVDHDISLLVPEIWCRLTAEERSARWLIDHGHLERVEDFEHEGRRVSAGLLGWRITEKFVNTFLGRIFDNPHVVFTPEMLRPETQDLAVFVDGMENVREAYRRVAQSWFDDGAVEEACPPLQALLHLMAHGEYRGHDVRHPEVRGLFTREALLASDWYRTRLETRQRNDLALWQRHVSALQAFLARPGYQHEAARLGLDGRLARARRELERVSSPEYLDALRGTVGADPIGAA